MALIHCDFFSQTLGMACSMCVILPERPMNQTQQQAASLKRLHPTLWLLHGLSDDHTIWQRRTSIERYVAPLGFAVVMPAVARSFYTDMSHGLRYWTFISEELPLIARSFFPLSEEREDNFVAGLSMGGYGAFKLALAHPERYAAAASLSGALNVVRILKPSDGTVSPEMLDIFGSPDSIKGSPNDLMFLASQLAASAHPRPALFQCCGTEDFLYQDNLLFRDHALSLGLPLEYHECPGTHDWGFWDEHIQGVLNWLPLPRQDTSGI